MSELIHITESSEHLVDVAVELSEKQAQPYLSEERKTQIARQMGYIFFELHCREEEGLARGDILKVTNP